MVTILALAVMVQAGSPESAVPPDSIDALMRDARRAQSNYERLSRALAPVTYSVSRSRWCDEYVGRFCLTFSPREERRDPPKEHPRVTDARRDVVESFRRVVAVAPADSAFAAQLVRYLVEDGRAAEAVSVARAFDWASDAPAWSAFLLGLAHQAAGEDSAAADHFRRALSHQTEEDRRAYTSIALLLTGEERRTYERMAPEDRADYEASVWRLADPLLLTPANEAWTDHMARHVWIRLLARSPRVNGSVSWGRDLEELTLRYGVPESRERLPSTYFWETEIHMLERYSPDQLWFVPAALRTRGLPPVPDPGEPWHLDEPAARSGHTPPAFRLSQLPHQVTRFPHGDSVVLRVDALAAADTMLAEPGQLATGLFLLAGEDYDIVHRETGTDTLFPSDSVAFSFTAALPPGEYVYSVEALAGESRAGYRARYPIELAAPAPGHVALSDILIAHPFPDEAVPLHRADPVLRALPNLVLGRGQDIGVYAEIHSLKAAASGLVRYSVEIALEPDRGTSIVRWFGRLLGFGGGDAPGVRWTAEAPGEGAAVVAVNLELGDLDPGMYTLRLTVYDVVGGTEAEASRRLRIGGAD